MCIHTGGWTVRGADDKVPGGPGWEGCDAEASLPARTSSSSPARLTRQRLSATIGERSRHLQTLAAQLRPYPQRRDKPNGRRARCRAISRMRSNFSSGSSTKSQPEWANSTVKILCRTRAGTGGQGNVQGSQDRPRQYRGDGWNRPGTAAPSAMPDPSRPVSESGGACFPIRRNRQGFRFGSTAIGRAGCSLVACCSHSAEAPADRTSERAKWVEQALNARQALSASIEGKSEEEIDPLLNRIPLRSPFKALG